MLNNRSVKKETLVFIRPLREGNGHSYSFQWIQFEMTGIGPNLYPGSYQHLSVEKDLNLELHAILLA